MALRTWTAGGADNKFSTAGNWDGAPQEGDDLLINIYDARGISYNAIGVGINNLTITLPADAAGSMTITMANNQTIGGTLSISSLHASNRVTLTHGTNYTLAVTGLVTLGAIATMTQGTGAWTFGAYTQNGASSQFTQGGALLTIGGDFAVSNGTFTPVASWTNTVKIAGNLNHSGGTLADSMGVYNMTGSNKSITLTGTPRVHGIKCTGTPITLNSDVITSGNFSVTAGVTVNVNAVIYAYNNAISSTATSTWQGTGRVEFVNSSNNITFGTFNIPLVIRIDSTSVSKSIGLSANTTLGSTLTIYSEHATNTITLSHRTNYTLSVTGAVTLGTRGVMTQGTGTWTFGSYTQNGESSQFTQGGDITVGDVAVSNGTFTANATYTVTCSGNFNQSAGTLTADVLRLTMTGAAKQVSIASTNAVHTLTVNGTSSASTDILVNNTLATGASGVLTIAVTKTLTLLDGTLTNSGSIDGTGTLAYQRKASDGTPTFGTISCPISITATADAAANRSVTLQANTTFGSTLSVSSAHAANTMTLSHGANKTLTVTGAVTLGTRGIMTQGTGTWTFGSYTQNGASSVFTQGGNVVVNGASAVSNGTLTCNATYTWTTTAFNHTAGTITPDVLRLIPSGLVTLTGSPSIHSLIASSDCSTGSSFTILNTLQTSATKTFTILNGATVTMIDGTLTNKGLIHGAGTLAYSRKTSDASLDFGQIKSILTISATADATANRAVTLVTPPTFGALTVSSSHAANTMTLATGNNNMECTSLTVGTRGIVTAGSSKITCKGNFNTANGTFTEGTSQVVIAGTSTVTLGVGDTGLYDLIIRNKAAVTLGSDIQVANMYANKGGLTSGAFSITQTDVKKNYSRRVLRKNLYRTKRRFFSPVDSYALDNIERAN